MESRTSLKLNIILGSTAAASILALIYLIFKRPKNDDNKKKPLSISSNIITISVNKKSEEIEKKVEEIQEPISIQSINQVEINAISHNQTSFEIQPQKLNPIEIKPTVTLNEPVFSKKKFDISINVSQDVNQSELISPTETHKRKKDTMNLSSQIIKKALNENSLIFGNFQLKQFPKDIDQEKSDKENGGSPSNGNIQLEEKEENSGGFADEDDDKDEPEGVPSEIDTEKKNSVKGRINTSKELNSIENNLVFDPQNKVIINSSEELKEILLGKLRIRDYSCIMKLNDIEINNSKEKLQVLNENDLLVILSYLHYELHPGLIELGDNFNEERRKYFRVDHETYCNIINFFLRKKEEFFLCVLSELMVKLNITQKVLDNTLFYYLNLADNSIKEVQKIKEAYDKVYHAGLKYSIAPKNLTKQKLHKVLKFQCDTYERLMNTYSNYEPDVIEIMVTDHVYLEFGLDREAIKAAIKKHCIYDDEEFIQVIQRFESFQNNSFINI